MRLLVFAVALALVALTAGCDGDAAAVPAPSATASATAVPPTLPPPTPTPDPLGPPPRDRAAALAVVTANAPLGACLDAAAIDRAWGAWCLAEDLDGDGAADAVYIVPLPPREGRTDGRGVAVVVPGGAGRAVQSFPSGREVDLSPLGRPLIALEERTGDGRPDLVFLGTACGAATCAGRVVIESWDGTAWRDAGPADDVEAIDRVNLTGSGARTVVKVHGGVIAAAGAGPQRGITVTYGMVGDRYQPLTAVPDPAEYLFHAIRDADGLFDRGRFDEAAASYLAALANPALRDWRAENGEAAGRPALVAYARLRVAVASAARGSDPTAGLDDLIRSNEEPIFVAAAEAFRRGYQQGPGVHAGCTEVTRYLGQEGGPARIRQIFDYGFANFPIVTFRDICPL